MAPPALALVDAAAWALVHLLAGYAAHRAPARWLDRERWWNARRSWEREGRRYRRLGVRRWKKWLPEAGDVFPGGFDKSRLARRDRPYLAAYLRETRRAELSHLLALSAAPAFLLWNPPWLAACMAAYALAANLPCIAAQRYNRLRLQRLLERRRRS
jgi:glycosyl-4,4'-diaponeurosporenoate acyltransferase